MDSVDIQFCSHSFTHIILIFRGPVLLCPQEVQKLPCDADNLDSRKRKLAHLIKWHGIMPHKPSARTVSLDCDLAKAEGDEAAELDIELHRSKTLDAIAASTDKQLSKLLERSLNQAEEDPISDFEDEIRFQMSARCNMKKPKETIQQATKEDERENQTNHSMTEKDPLDSKPTKKLKMCGTATAAKGNNSKTKQ